jgi:hypothetical protein
VGMVPHSIYKDKTKHHLQVKSAGLHAAGGKPSHAACMHWQSILTIYTTTQHAADTAGLGPFSTVWRTYQQHNFELNLKPSGHCTQQQYNPPQLCRVHMHHAASHACRATVMVCTHSHTLPLTVSSQSRALQPLSGTQWRVCTVQGLPGKRCAQCTQHAAEACSFSCSFAYLQADCTD